jgi:hypothetical protein
VHQTGSADLERIQECYRTLGLAQKVVVKAFIEDMATAYADADLVVARAGALTLAERPLSEDPRSSSHCPRRQTITSARTPRSLQTQARPWFSTRARRAARSWQLRSPSWRKIGRGGPTWERPCAASRARRRRRPLSIAWKYWRTSAPGSNMQNPMAESSFAWRKLEAPTICPTRSPPSRSGGEGGDWLN